MAATFDLESVDGVAIGIAHGPLTLDEIKESAATMWRLVDGPDVRILWDLRDAHFDLAATEVRDLAEFVKRFAPSSALRTAFVVSRDLAFGLVRMFEVFREREGARTSVFRDKQQAVDWLTNDDAFYEDTAVKPSDE